MAEIIALFRVLLQLGDWRFRRVLIRSVAYSAALIVGFGIAAGWLVSTLPDTVALPLVGKLTLPLVGEVTVPLVGEVAVPFRQVELINLPLIVMVSSLLMFPAAGAVVNLMLDEIVDTVEARYYPHLPGLYPSGQIEIITGAIAFSVLVLTVNLGALIFYVVAGALAPFVFWAVNGLLIGREFFTLVAGRRLPPDEVAALRRTHGWRIWLVGCLIAVPLSLPLISLVIPALGAAIYAHAFHRFCRPEPANKPQPGEPCKRDSEVGGADFRHGETAAAPVEGMARRLKRLKALRRVKSLEACSGPQAASDLTDEDRLLQLACRLGDISKPALNDLVARRRTDREHHALSNGQRFVLAVASGEQAAIEALSTIAGAAISTDAKATKATFARAYEEWQRIQAARPMGGLATAANYLDAVLDNPSRTTSQGEFSTVSSR